jgi:hypothetical protein
VADNDDVDMSLVVLAVCQLVLMLDAKMPLVVEHVPHFGGVLAVKLGIWTCVMKNCERRQVSGCLFVF